MHMYFRHCRLASFQRQLSLYQFRRARVEKGGGVRAQPGLPLAYPHPKFRRSADDAQLRGITRAAPKAKPSGAEGGGAGGPEAPPGSAAHRGGSPHRREAPPAPGPAAVSDGDALAALYALRGGGEHAAKRPRAETPPPHAAPKRPCVETAYEAAVSRARAVSESESRSPPPPPPACARPAAPFACSPLAPLV